MSKRYLITGGAGFIGSNYADRLLSQNQEVVLFDNLSRDGAEKNLAWLSDKYTQESFRLVQADVRDYEMLLEAAKGVDVIVHLAAQVAVTTSVQEPREDFEVNALGTFNVLETARIQKIPPVVLYASTNKVYGNMEEIRIAEKETRYHYVDYPHGIPESYPLDFHSPYGCSKGAGDQYVHDYGRIYRIPTVVFRQSCIYGERQFGIEDQGWVAWFIIAAITGRPITIYGDGKQVRDVLYIGDLIDCYEKSIEGIEQAAGEVFNIGGGPEYTLSIWKEFGAILEDLTDQKIPASKGDWRPGDQLVYVSDIRKAEQILGWTPKTDVKTGFEKLYHWVKDNPELFSAV